MRFVLFIFMLLSFICLRAQDIIYFVDGTSKNCKITAVTPEYLEIIEAGGAEAAVSRILVILVEYKNGSVEIYNSPKVNVVYNPVSDINTIKEKKELKSSALKPHHVSLNTLGLVNADIAAFYEYYPTNLPISMGLMGAYNFNLKAGISNANFAFLNNAKKNYDLGAMFNFYPEERVDGELRIFFGLMFKYTDFSFDVVKIDSVPGPAGSSQILTFRKTRGYQMASMLSIGADLFLNETFFIKGIAAIGACGLRGDYKQAYNEEKNKNNGRGMLDRQYNYVAKMYLGINIGINF